MAAAAQAMVRVLSAGQGTTLQDAGRHGYLRFGFTAAGPMDSLRMPRQTLLSAIRGFRRRGGFPGWY